MKFEDRNHTGRPPTSDDFFRVVPWTAFPDNRMGVHPDDWLLTAINDEARITVEDSFECPAIYGSVESSSSSSSSSSSKKRKN